jgi:glycosyltransferase involved in cell wall biosynthesis
MQPEILVTFNPLVSVVVPVFNCERFLAEALRSIFSQDYRPLEVIVVDDGSTDESAAVAFTFPEVKLIRQENGGVAAARNAGLAATQGGVIAWLDADDYWLPGKLTAEIRHLAENPSTEITLCHQRAFATPGDPEPLWLQSPRALKGFSYSLYASVMRREVFDRIGTFNTALRVGEDFDWYLRAKEAGVRLDILDSIFTCHRARSDSLTENHARTRQETIQVAKLALLRRRAAKPE